jgi:hypothetical protein
MTSTVNPIGKNITIYQHADWAMGFQWMNDGVPVDLAGYTLDAMIRRTYADAAPAVTFEVGVLSAPDGYFELRLTDEQTTALAFDVGVYDIRATAGTRTERIVQGVVRVAKGATRA